MTSSSIVAVWASSRSTMLASSPGRFLVGMMAATVSRVTSSSGGTIELTRLGDGAPTPAQRDHAERERDRKSTRLNSSHVSISYAVFCLKKKKKKGASNAC